MLKIRPGLVLAVAAATLGPLLIIMLWLWLYPDPDPNGLSHYAADDLRLEKAAVRPEAVFIGDSLTEYWTWRAPEAWRPNWVNRGIGGQRSDQVRARFAQDVLALRPRAVVILVGTNDDWGRNGVLSLAETEADIAAMSSSARTAGIHVVLASAPPVSLFVWPPMLGGGEARIETMNAWIRAYAAHTGVTYADYWSVMTPALTVDGIHPSAAGYAIMAGVARRVLSS